MAGRFGSVLTAMVTPFDAEGALDLDATVALARWLEANAHEAHDPDRAPPPSTRSCA